MKKSKQGYQEPKGSVQIKLGNPDTDGSTDEPVVPCHVQVVENTFIDDCK